MAVKVTDDPAPGADAAPIAGPPAPDGLCGPPSADVRAAMDTLMSLMPSVIRAWKRGPQGAEETPGAVMRELFRDGRLGPRHGAVIIALIHTGPLAVSDLARRLGLSVATVSLMVGELDRAGLVERREDAGDRRRTLVSVREEHRCRFESFFTERIAPLRRALERMTPEMREHFVLGWRLLAEETSADPSCTPEGGGGYRLRP